MHPLCSTFAPALLPAILGESVLHPVAILVLCVAAGVGTVLLLPGRRETSIRTIGGVILLAALLIFAAIVVRQTAAYTAGDAYFWVFSAIAIISAIRVISHSKPVYSALYFVLAVLATAGLFVLLWAEFMAAALILIYAGAILVTYVFVIMLAAQVQSATPGEDGGADYDRFSREPVLASAIGFALMGVILFAIFQKGELIQAVAPSEGAEPAAASASAGSAADLGRYLFDRQLVTLELAGLLLTVSMVGAVIIARRQVAGAMPASGEITEPENMPVTVGAPLTVEDNPHTIPVYGTTNPQAKAYPER